MLIAGGLLQRLGVGVSGGGVGVAAGAHAATSHGNVTAVTRVSRIPFFTGNLQRILKPQSLLPELVSLQGRAPSSGVNDGFGEIIALEQKAGNTLVRLGVAAASLTRAHPAPYNGARTKQIH
jgi:hypothetical protein